MTTPAMQAAEPTSNVNIDGALGLAGNMDAMHVSEAEKEELVVVPTKRELEQNRLPPDFVWSKSGHKHVEYAASASFEGEVGTVNGTSTLGAGGQGRVQAVICKGMLIARKHMHYAEYDMDCRREAEMLEGIVHHHVIQLVGSYVERARFYLLLHPVAQGNLKDFMRVPQQDRTLQWETRMKYAFGCLASAVAFLHAPEIAIKHKDIKPANVLMFQGTPMLTDFALSTTFKGQENSFSSGTTGLSRLYAAPEVVSMKLRNTSQDIFSLGLVFQDIFWTLHGSTHGNATDTCGDHRQHSYQGSELMPEERKFFAELPKLIFDWSPVLREKDAFCSLIRIMTAAQPVDRPSAKVVEQFLMRPSFLGRVCGDCCHSLLAFYTQEAGTWASWTAIKRTATGTTYVSSIPSSDPSGPVPLSEVHNDGPRFDLLDVSVRFASSQNRDNLKIDVEEPGPQKPESHYEKFVRSRGFLPHLGYGFNWSGRGRHVEYTKDEQPPLTPIRVLGMSGFSLVEAVRCEQVILARKSVRMPQRRGTLDKIFREVEHLERLRHRHTIQLVGTYLQGKTLSQLMYPVANCNLSEFMESCFGQSIEFRRKNRISLKRAFACIAQAVDYLHEKNIIHRDIKPENILVKFPTSDWDTAETPHGLFAQVYVTDFGISKFLDGDLTEARTFVWTPAHRPPELNNEPESYGLSVDIFSLGCVFLEMQSVLLGQSVQELRRLIRRRRSNRLYSRSPDGVAKAIQNLMQHKSPIDGLHIPPSEIRSRLRMISKMTSQDPLDRPIAGDVAMAFGSNECCHLDREAEGGFDPEASEVKRDPDVQSWKLDAEATRPAVPVPYLAHIPFQPQKKRCQ